MTVSDRPIQLVVIVDEIYSDAAVNKALRSLGVLPKDPLCVLELQHIVELAGRAATAAHFQELIGQTCAEHGRHAQAALRGT